MIGRQSWHSSHWSSTWKIGNVTKYRMGQSKMSLGNFDTKWVSQECHLEISIIRWKSQKWIGCGWWEWTQMRGFSRIFFPSRKIWWTGRRSQGSLFLGPWSKQFGLGQANPLPGVRDLRGRTVEKWFIMWQMSHHENNNNPKKHSVKVVNNLFCVNT
jgi:hypothetical protein